MKKLTVISLLLFKSIILIAQIDVDLKFYDNCKDSIVLLDYELSELSGGGKTYYSELSKAKVSKLGIYFLSSGIKRGDYTAIFDHTIEIRDSHTYVDTLTIPNILFSGDGALHSQFWTYTNCNKICNGEEIDYYPNGNIRLKGFFVDGKPSVISEYRVNGSILTRETYDVGTQDYKKIEYFDLNGLTDEYDIKKRRKRKTIINTYNANDKLIDKKIQKHQ